MIKIIALDLDGTLLNEDKELSVRNKTALEKAALLGVEIVPATGRYYNNLPDCIKKLDFINYAITINGAYVYDIKNDKCIYRSELPNETALRLFSFMNRYDVIYDCYQDNKGWINSEFQKKAELYGNTAFVEALKEKRISVDDITKMVASNGRSIQKTQCFSNNREMLDEMAKEISNNFSDVAVSSSVRNNVEINAKDANKGQALTYLAQYLGVDINNTAAFGDGGNDFSMIKAAGIGVAMESGREDLKAVADRIAPPCFEDGVGIVIEELLKD